VAITYRSFVAAFPEFTDPKVYLESQIEFWIPLAYMQLNAIRFGQVLDLAACLFVAHNIVLSKRETLATSSGGLPGDVRGPVLSETVDKVSVTYADKGVWEKGGAWNTTTYGQRLYTLMKAYGGGPVYFGRTGSVCV
jgi:hypothetical protein